MMDCHIPLRSIRNDGMRSSKRHCEGVEVQRKRTKQSVRTPKPRHCESDEGGRGNLFARQQPVIASD
jgi:hypothetical protein